MDVQNINTVKQIKSGPNSPMNSNSSGSALSRGHWSPTSILKPKDAKDGFKKFLKNSDQLKQILNKEKSNVNLGFNDQLRMKLSDVHIKSSKTNVTPETKGEEN
jgi:hypothetical protein